MRAVIDGPIGQEMLDKITASSAKMVGLGWMDGGSRSLYTKKPVRKPDDLKGMKIRMMGNPLFVDTMNAMGGNGISMGYGEVFTAIQTGVVDGAENNPPSYESGKHYEVAGYYSLTEHLMVPEIFVFSKKVWDTLSPLDQQLIRKAAVLTTQRERKLWAEREEKSLAVLKEKGIEVIRDIDNAPLMVFAVVGAILFVFMVRA
jgi:TRAP-type C4-dicarboxylate transport system substrate-binding protein